MNASPAHSRRRFLETSALALGSGLLARTAGDRPGQEAAVRVLNPRARVPVSIIIDDSTCLVNLNKFAIPQFAAVNPGRYNHYPWKSWPDEIPDDFVRKFADWAGENGVKGKYSVVPFPACVGRLDRARLREAWRREGRYLLRTKSLRAASRRSPLRGSLRQSVSRLPPTLGSSRFWPAHSKSPSNHGCGPAPPGCLPSFSLPLGVIKPH